MKLARLVSALALLPAGALFSIACGSNGRTANVGGQDASAQDASARDATADVSAEGDATPEQAFDASLDASVADASSAPDAATEAGPTYLTDAVDLSIGSDLACAIRQTGGIACWGSSSNIVAHEFRLPADAGAPRQVVVNFRTICVLDTGGTVWCLGDNYAGELGIGAPSDLDPHTTPAPVVDSSGQPIQAVGIGGAFTTTCAIRQDGSVLCWGKDDSGQLGQDAGFVNDAGIPYSPFAVPVPGVSFAGGTVAKGNGSFVCAGGDAGTACWGINTQTECLADVSPTAFNTAVADVLADAGAAMPARQISLGYVHGCVLDGTGQVYCWGDNSAFERGSPEGSPGLTPNLVTGLVDAGVQAIACGASWSCALDGAGHVRCFGGNDQGQLGRADAGLPVASILSVVDVDGGGVLSGVARVYAGAATNCAVLGPAGSSGPGPVLCWGYGPDVGGVSTVSTGVPEAVLLP